MAEPLPAIGMTFAEAAEVYQQKLKTDLRFKPRTKGKRRQAIRAILEHLGLPSEPPALTPARAPPVSEHHAWN